MKMEMIEGSETSAISIVTPGNYQKENILLIKCTLLAALQWFLSHELSLNNVPVFADKTIDPS